MHSFIRAVLALCGLLQLLCAEATGANAATITVTTPADSGPGSLRQALVNANSGDIIQFDPALNGQSITLTTAELVIATSVTINGPGPDLLTIRRDPQAPLFRIFHVLTGTTSVINGLTITGGAANDRAGGGILKDGGTLAIMDCMIRDNLCLGGLGARGGGIFNTSGAMTIINSTIRDNRTLEAGGVFNGSEMQIDNSTITGNHAYEMVRGGVGGGIINDGTLTITDSIVDGNHAGEPNPFPTPTPMVTPFPTGYGGGIEHGNGTLTIQRSSISGNTTTGSLASGGGIFSSAQLSVMESTIGSNLADHDGAGIYLTGPSTIVSSTIDGNTAGRDGGGIDIAFSATASIKDSTVSNNQANSGGGIIGTSTISNSTISGNTADTFGGGISGGGSITNSTISGNSGGSIATTSAVEIGNTILKTGASGSNIEFRGGGVTSRGYNLSNDDGSQFLTGPGDLINTDPMLGLLQDNGGPTFTHELLPGSPAINSGDPNFTPPPLYDQRGIGYDRVVTGRVDIGSFEVQLPTPTATATAMISPSPTLTPTPTTTPTPTPTPTPTTTASPSPISAQALNISTRMRVDTGDNVLIGGFIITGTAPKSVAVRGLGPSLGAAGVTDALADPTLELRESNGGITLIASNDDWQDNSVQAAELTKLGLGLPDAKESGLVAILNPAYTHTAILAGKNGGTGVGLLEIYDTDPGSGSQLANISTRGLVQTGNDVMIGGFILGGNNTTVNVVIRGIGPSLTQAGVSNALADPTLELRNGNGALLVANDNWEDDPLAAQLIAHGLAPQNSLESGIFVALPPGVFTAILAGTNNTTGVALVEIYNVNPQPP